MALEFAIDIKNQLEALGFEATIHGDDFKRHYVRIQYPERRRFDSVHEFNDWLRNWADRSHSGA